MAIFKETFTTPAAGTNLLADDKEGISAKFRKLMKVGFIGGAAIADGRLKIYVGSKVIVDIRNNQISDVFDPDADYLPVGGEWVPPKTQLVAELATATGADNYSLYLDLKDM